MSLGAFDLHIFDLDDTLINTKASYWFAQMAAVEDLFPHLEKNQRDALAPQLKWLCNLFGSGKVKAYMEAFLRSYPDLFSVDESLIDALRHRYDVHFQSKLVCFEGVFACLDYLTRHQKQIAIVSNGMVDSQMRKLRLTGLDSCFPNSAIYISSEYPWDLQKPSPFLVEKACSDRGVKPGQAVYYGNAVVDMVAGNLAGVTTVHFNGTTSLPDDLPPIAVPDDVIQSWTDARLF